MRLRLAIVLATAAGAAFATAGRGAVFAHKTVNSKYTFNKDVRPILQQRCGQCHAADDISGMPLQTYQETRSQLWPLTQSLMSGRMPPWYGEPGVAALKNPRGLPARELDILMTWLAGGTPEGAPAPGAAAASPAPSSPHPDLVVAMPAPFVLEPGRERADHEVILPSEGVRGKWIRAVALMPGAPAIVRSAEIAVKSPAGEQVIELWLPGEAPPPLEGGAAFLVPEDASLVARIHYRRPRGGDAAAVSDRSRLGLFFSPATSARSVQAIDVTSERRLLDRAVRVVAVRPVDGPEDAQVRIDAVSPTGGRQTLVRLTIRNDWPRRYALARPVVLERGTWIEVRVIPRPDLWRAMTGATGYASVIQRQFRAALEIVD